MGAIYTRGRRIYETARARTEAEMREIIELAVEKRVDQEVETFRRRLESLIGRAQVQPPDRERYDEERGPL